MPAKSKKQQRFMGMVHAAQKGEKPASGKVAKVAKSIKKGDAEDFASTKHKGLPNKVRVKELIKKMVREIMREGGPGSGPHNGEDNPFDREPSDDEMADIEKECESVNEVNFEKIKLPAQVNRFLNKFVQSMKDTKLNRIKRSAILYKVIEASGMSIQQLMADVQKIKKELK